MTASVHAETKSQSRRAFLAGALGGLGAVAATVAGRPSRARAADGEAVVVGGEYFSTSQTLITNTSNASAVIHGDSVTGTGIWGTSNSTHGVVGGSFATNKAAILGVSELAGSSTGVVGASGAIPTSPAKTGVYGYAAQDAFSRGVTGQSPAGIGVYGLTSTGYAGYFGGRVYTTQFFELTDIPTPAAPIANRARLFVKDNGSGKSQLCVRFHTGAIRIIAQEP